MRGFNLRYILLNLTIVYSSFSYSLVPETASYCRSVQDNALAILADYKSDGFSERLIEYSRTYPIDDDCYRWQFVILNNLNKFSLQPSGYRQYLYDRIGREGAAPKNEFMLHLLHFSLASSALSDHEWQIVKESFNLVDKVTLHAIVLALVTSPFEDDDSVQRKMADIFSLAKNGRLGTEKNIGLSHAIELFLQVTAEQRPDLFSSYYLKYHYLLDDESNKNLSLLAVRFFNENQNSYGLEFLSTFIGNANISGELSRKFFLLLLKLHREKNNNPYYSQVVDSLVNQYPAKVRHIIEQANLSNKRKELLKIEYQLELVGEFKITEYAEKLFYENRRVQNKAAEYLIAYGERANVVKYDVQSKLMSLKESNGYSMPSKLIASLLKILSNIGSTDQETIDMMIWAMENGEGKLSKQAFHGLKAIGVAALPEYRKNFHVYSNKVQRLVVEVMASFHTDKLPALKFLSQVKPSNDKVRFAVQDAVAELNEF